MGVKDVVEVLAKALADRPDDVRVEGLRVVRALFGILAELVNRARILGNEVEGDAAKTLGLRGDAIRLWEVRESEVARNRVSDAREIGRAHV